MGERHAGSTVARLRLVGRFRLEDGVGAVVDLPNRRARALLACLALASDHTESRERLCGLLWSDRGESQARASLRQCLLDLKGALSGVGLDLLDIRREAVALRRDKVAVDTEAFDMSLDAGPDAITAKVAEVGDHSLLDDLMVGGLFEEWRAHARERFDRSIAAAVEAQLTTLEAQSDWARTRALAEAYLQRDRLDENIVAAAIRADIALGATGAAHRRFQVLEAGLAKELGVAPGPVARAALARVGSDVATSAATAPSLDETAARDRPAPVDRPSIAVMPFKNLGDLDQEYFSDGISEDILTDLSKVSALSVAARSTTFSFKGQSVNVHQIGRELDVRYVLEGSVRKAGERVRITAQLVDVIGSTHLWAERWDRTLTDIFALQDEISQAVVAALKLKLLPRERDSIQRRGTTHPDAYNLYLMARQHRASGNEGNLRREREIIRLCGLATDIDPTYARAWTLLALSQSVLHFNFRAGAEDGLAAAERALSLDPGMADAHAVKARHLTNQGKHGEARGELEIALRLDPDCWEANKQLGLQSFRQNRFEDAIRFYAKAADLVETDYSAAMMLMTSRQAAGDMEGATLAAHLACRRAEKAVDDDSSNGSALAIGCMAFAFLGETDKARDWARRALVIDPRNLVVRYNLACALSAHLNDVDGALDILEGFFADGQGFWLAHAKSDPDLAPVRADPRFAAMVNATEARLASAS